MLYKVNLILSRVGLCHFMTYRPPSRKAPQGGAHMSNVIDMSEYFEFLQMAFAAIREQLGTDLPLDAMVDYDP